jgi:hypothetical protein
METAPFTSSKVSCYAGMNTTRRISCSENFFNRHNMAATFTTWMGWAANARACFESIIKIELLDRIAEAVLILVPNLLFLQGPAFQKSIEP